MKRKELTSLIKENRNFNLLWTSQALSQITLNMINFVMATRIYEKTGSTLAVSFLWVFYYLPAFFLGPFSGFFVDLAKRRKVLLVANLLQALTMVLFLFVGGNIYPVYSLVFLYSFLNQFYCPAESASIPWLVKKSDLPLANSLFMLTSQSALVFGLGVSGILMRFMGQDAPIFIAIISLSLAALAVYFLPKNEPKKGKITQDFGRFWEEIRAGYTFVKDTRIILFPLLLAILFQVFMVVLGVTAPSFAGKVLNIEISDAGPLLAVPLGLGSLSGAILMPKFSFRYRKRTLMKNGFFVVFLVLAFFFAGFAQSWRLQALFCCSADVCSWPGGFFHLYSQSNPDSGAHSFSVKGAGLWSLRILWQYGHSALPSFCGHNC